MIELHTLGAPTLRGDGTALAQLAAHKQKLALLVYIAMEGPVSRDQLLGVFWPERVESKARHSLSQALYTLRSELGSETISSEGDSIFIESRRFSVDTVRFERAVADEDWDKATQLYQGHFLADFHLPGAPVFEEWLSTTRTRLGRLARKAFAARLEDLVADGETEEALSHAWRWTAIEPLEDQAQHALISLLARVGKRTAALEQYETYRGHLARELGVEPLEQTVTLVERIRQGETAEGILLDTFANGDNGTANGDLGDGGRDTKERETSAQGLTAFLKRLRERHVVQVLMAYLAVSALALELTDVLIDRGILGGWLFPFVLVLALLGLPATLFLAWTEPDSQRRDSDPGGLLPGGLRTGQVMVVLISLAAGLLVGRMLVRPAATDGQNMDLDPLHIAVLYFDDLSRDGSLSHLSEGVTKALITELTQVEPLTVASLNAVKSYRDRELPLDSIVSLLRVGTLVEGSLMESAGNLRLDVHLVDAAGMNTISSVSLERPRQESIRLVQDVAREVAALLRQRLGVTIRTHELKTGTDNAQAWELVQRGERLRQDAQKLYEAGDTLATAVHLARADSLFALAESLDPDWVEPIILRGWVEADRAKLLAKNYQSYLPEALRQGIARANRALRIDETSAAAFELRGVLRANLWNVAEGPGVDTLKVAAERDLRAAITRAPARARALSSLSELLQSTGRFQEAKLFAERAYEADAFLKETNAILFRLCYTSYEMQQSEDVKRWCSEGRRRFPNQGGYTEIELSALASSHGGKPDLKRAWELFQSRQAAVPPQRRAAIRPEGLMYVAAVAARAGLRDSALSLIDMAWSTNERPNPFLHYLEANVHQQLDDFEAGLEALRAYLEAEPQRREYITRDWYLEELRQDPRFDALLGDAS